MANTARNVGGFAKLATRVFVFLIFFFVAAFPASVSEKSYSVSLISVFVSEISASVSLISESADASSVGIWLLGFSPFLRQLSSCETIFPRPVCSCLSARS